MDDEEIKKKSFTIWIYLIPIFILAAWPAFKWMKKANSGDLELSKDDYSVFNSQEGEIRKAAPPAAGAPEFDYGVLGVRYKSKAREAGDEKTAAEERTQEKEAAKKRTATENPGRGGQTAAGQGGTDSTKSRELQSLGFTKGFMISAVGRVLNNPKAVGMLFSNKYVVNGFMARDTVKAATGSPQGLANYLKSGAPANFINNPIVKAAMNNPGIVSAMASSGLVSAMMDTPAVKALMNDPKILGDLITTNPQLMSTLMSNPNIMNALANNPNTSGLMSQFNMGGIPQRK